jgi:uncharacterized protein (UPF0261 family)
MAKPTILIVGTFDTKRDELLYLRSQIHTLSNGSCSTKLLDVSRTLQSASALSVPENELVPRLLRIATPERLPRGEYVKITIEQCIPLVHKLVESSTIHGIVSAGGSTGTSLATALMREACPVGFPKMMVSTMASGDIKHLVKETDITMMYSVVDVAGMNSILGRILANAAGAMVGMAMAYKGRAAADKYTGAQKGKRIAITMFGVTTPCVDKIREILTSPPHDKGNHEIYIFHATGSGGLAMERLIREGQIDAVIDLTTTEIADELFGGVLAAGPRRLEAAAEMGIPMVVSVGACDMVNFGPKDTVPEHRRGRNLFEHNPAVTLMRTNKEENIEIGNFIAEKLSKHAKKPESIEVLLPVNGISMIATKGEAFYDPSADEALFSTLREGLERSGVRITELDHHINEDAFAKAVVATLMKLMENPRRQHEIKTIS